MSRRETHLAGTKVPGLGGLRRVVAHGTPGDYVPAALLHEVWKALPAEHPCRGTLVQWTNARPGTEISRKELEKMAQELLTFAHGYQGEEAELARLEGTQAGLIVRPDRGVSALIHAPVVLALSFQRLLLLEGVGSWVEVAAEAEAAEAA
jgi:hypothetical protein